MRLFKWDFDAERRATEAELATVQADLAAARATITSLTEETAAARQGTEAAQAATLAAKGRLDEANALLESLDKREAQLPEEIRVRVNMQTGQRLAGVGVQPIAEDVTVDPTRTGKATWTEKSIAASRSRQ